MYLRLMIERISKKNTNGTLYAAVERDYCIFSSNIFILINVKFCEAPDSNSIKENWITLISTPLDWFTSLK